MTFIRNFCQSSHSYFIRRVVSEDLQHLKKELVASVTNKKRGMRSGEKTMDRKRTCSSVGLMTNAMNCALLNASSFSAAEILLESRKDKEGNK